MKEKNMNFARKTVASRIVISMLAGLLIGAAINEISFLFLRESARAPKVIELVIDHGKYHLARRMIAAAGNHVDQLHRYGVGKLSLEDGSLPELDAADWRYLRPKHLELLGYQP